MLSVYTRHYPRRPSRGSATWHDPIWAYHAQLTLVSWVLSVRHRANLFTPPPVGNLALTPKALEH
jgi:hypothetical protein